MALNAANLQAVGLRKAQWRGFETLRLSWEVSLSMKAFSWLSEAR